MYDAEKKTSRKRFQNKGLGMRTVDHIISQHLAETRSELEQAFDADVLAYYGEIATVYMTWFRQRLEDIGTNRKRKSKLVVVLNTSGGEVEAVERMVEMIRHFYTEVYFVIPHLAMSAGTIFCMSGDKIFMDYSSSLGPIDPQVQSKDGKWVPALGYLDKFEQILAKAAAGTLTNVEYAIAQNQDMAELRRYEQARDLSVTLLKEWLTKYKFKDWVQHRSVGPKQGQPVTQAEKEERANEIAMQLGDNKLWHSHARRIGINTLRNKLRLEIDDYSQIDDLREKINNYHDLITDYMRSQNWSIFINATTMEA
jgi:hypothetical protein